LKSGLTVLLICFSIATAFGQYTTRDSYDIKVARHDDVTRRCGSINQKLEKLPAEVQFASKVIGDSIFLVFNDVKLFWQFFESKKDGFAIDIVNKDQFQCDNIQRLSGSYTHKGYLLPPVYRDEIRKRIHYLNNDVVYVFAGLVPKQFDKTKIETNHMLLQDQYQCSYTTIINVGGHAWNMLPMGLYYDTLNNEKLEEQYKDLSKTLKFVIPFAKNTSVYKKEDIKPLYDSLRLTDYAITDIHIKAFTSVEGSLERNIKLQDERAQSIVDAMQSFQSESIQSQISSNENWVEFLDAIAKTSSAYLGQMSKDEVKDALKDPKLAEKLEPVLAKERKAIIELVLEKRISYLKATAGELKTYFSQNINKKNIDEAMLLQQIIFHKIDRKELPSTFLTELDVPKSVEYGGLLMNRVAFDYEHNNRDVLDALNAFTELNELLGGNPKIDYNICALRLKAWVKLKTLPGTDPLKAKIESLRKSIIPAALVTRLLINYHIIFSEVNYAMGNYADREKSIRYVFDTYKKIPMNDDDLVGLALFMSYNSRFDQAALVLEPRIKALDASEDLLFYYVILTISKQKYLSSGGYRTFLLNVVNSNKSRFCQLFYPVSQGGLSFQVLENSFLKKTWCENCNLKP
jgi:outer membrane protein OmpA-like peptidoglycan-associated protein